MVGEGISSLARSVSVLKQLETGVEQIETSWANCMRLP